VVFLGDILPIHFFAYHAGMFLLKGLPWVFPVINPVNIERLRVNDHLTGGTPIAASTFEWVMRKSG